MRRSLSLILILAGAGLLAACATPQRHPVRPGMAMPPGGGPGGPGGMARGGLFVSPAGEPFRRAEGGPPPLGAWFGQADADHDGVLVRAEFEADFVRWFAVLDADHDGEIAPAEVARYETEILPEMQSRFGPGGGGMRMMRGGGMGRGGTGPGGRGGGRRALQSGGAGGGRGAMAMMSGAARFGLIPINHPVMDADADFNRGVSRQEFAAAAARRFAMLDTAHDGRLTLAQLAEARRQAFGARRRDGPRLDEGESAPPPGGN
jgi:hypothetical protein